MQPVPFCHEGTKPGKRDGNRRKVTDIYDVIWIFDISSGQTIANAVGFMLQSLIVIWWEFWQMAQKEPVFYSDIYSWAVGHAREWIDG